MSVLTPELLSAPGTLKLQIVDSIATLTAPKMTEINAATSLDISCFVLSDGWNPDAAQSKGTAPRRVCTVATQETLGSATETLPDLLYAYDPQGAPSVDANKLYTKAAPGGSKFIIARYGLAFTVDWAIGQYVQVHRVRFGLQIPQAPIADDNGVHHIKQAITNAVPVTPRALIVA